MDNFEKILQEEESFIKGIYSSKNKPDYFGLAFSGGGIRSATFNLGTLQALAKAELLNKVDYLSTVSGGGYIGSWLTALIHDRRKNNPQFDHQQALQQVEKELGQRDKAEEPQEIRFLREYSNYLTPKAGLFSNDTLSSIANYLRNLYLNQATLLAILIALLLVPRLIYFGFQEINNKEFPLIDSHGLWLVAFIGLVWVTVISAIELSKNVNEQVSTDKIGYLVLTPMFISALALSYQLNNVSVDKFENTDSLLIYLLPFVLVGSLAYGMIYLLIMLPALLKILSDKIMHCWHTKRLSLSWDFNFRLVAPFVAGALGGLLCFLLMFLFQKVSDVPEARIWFAIAIGPLLVLKIFSLVVVLHIGLVSRGFSEENREWWGRLGGMMIHLALMWLVWFGIAIYGPIFWMWSENWLLYLGGSGWLASTIAGVFLGHSDKCGAKNSNPLLEKVLSITPYIFIVGMLLLLSYGIDYLSGGIVSQKPLFAAEQVSLQTEVKAQLPLKSEIEITGGHAQSLSRSEPVITEFKAAVPQFNASANLYLPGSLSFKKWADDGLKRMAFADTDAEMQKIAFETQAIAFAGCLLLFALLSWRVDINLFSMHHYYHNRLTRCYLGASRMRKPSPFTGFDPEDDVPLAECAQKPYHLINTAINLVGGSNLAWQQRKAGSFVFTPKFCGYEFDGDDCSKDKIGGFRPTEQYMSDPHDSSDQIQGVKLGTAFAISGAAASPNMGYHSSPGLAFLMTMFNVRLGRWCGNPALKCQELGLIMGLWVWLTAWAREEKPGEEWKAMGPSFSGKYLLSELLGMSSDETPFVYLSDGGHFENLALYELVRRKCKLIVVCDVGADPDMGFEDLGNAIRKCKIDFGAEIDLDIEPLKRKTDTEAGDGGNTSYRFSQRHWQKGEINYLDAQKGSLFYIKSSLTEGDPAEIKQYALQEPTFPHQTTADQWFDETQFESYRRLGEVIGEDVCGEIRKEIAELKL